MWLSGKRRRGKEKKQKERRKKKQDCIPILVTITSVKWISQRPSNFLRFEPIDV